MELKRNSQSRLSYSNLFNLESLMSYQLPQRDRDIDAYGSSSQDESIGSQGRRGMDHDNGYAADRFADLSVHKRKRSAVKPEPGLLSSLRREPDSNDEGEDDYDARMTEEQYRTMLGEHVHKYHRKRYRDSATGPTYRSPMNVPKPSHGSKFHKSRNDSFAPAKEEMTSHHTESSPELFHTKSVPEYDDGSEFASSLDSTYLEIGEGITYQIPPSYDKLATSLKLPSFSDIRIEEHYLKGTLDLQSLASMVASDRRFRVWSHGGMGEPLPQYESLQAKLNALSALGSVEKFSLQVSDVGLDALGIPEGAAGRIRRLILSESGILQVFYVKVLEKGDTYEIIERSLPKKQVAKKDPSVIEKEEIEKISKLWMNVVKRDLPRHHRMFTSIHRKRYGDAKRCSETCQREVKLKVSRSLKVMRGASIRTRKLARDMLVFWKRVDKEQAELRKKEEKEAAEALKREEELREAKRQQQRLNFLLSQTELYSHFMQNKSATQASENLDLADGDMNASEMASAYSDIKPEEEDDAEELELKKEALRAAQNAVSKQKKITSAFDSECLKLRQTVETEAAPNETLASESLAGSSNIDLLHPSTMPSTSSVRTPEMFKGTLKEYQLKGLQWLVNCYEQGLNGILADEMGLGKTIQAMAFLAHLAEEKNIWGPFLVVAPSSVLNNWVDEVSRFCPDLKTLPYWGGAQERQVLRKNINPKRLYRRDAGFHILITSYQLLVSDDRYLRRVKWQYMVLDEAQAIKSSTSIRWKTLLIFNCRNRLLLTGTPIQNNMAELWALLHFIMPTLFDSHEQFNEWFSKGIENHAEHGGTLNEHQLNRLHAVLKPFMLRRVKKDVISEMTGKTEVTVHCKLSTRQQAFYQAIKNKISLAELIDGSRGSLNEKKFLNLMNIVIQLRKVCNHPELFERNEGSTYVYFAKIPNPLLPPPFGELDVIHYPGGCNPITYEVPKLVIQESSPGDELPWVTIHRGSEGLLDKLFNIYSPENVHRASVPLTSNTPFKTEIVESGAFGFTRLMDLSPMEVFFLMKGSFLERFLFSVLKWDRMFVDDILDMFMEVDSNYDSIEKEKGRAVSRMLLIPMKNESSFLWRRLATGPGHAPYEALALSHKDRLSANTKLLHSTYAFIPRARAPPVNVHCSSRNFAYRMVEELHDPWIKRLLLGFARTSEFNGPKRPTDVHHLISEIDSELHISEPIFQQTFEIFGSSPPMRNFDPAKMLTESGKLQMLDTLLKRLRAENHRVLLFAQMTKMLDILEDYMNYRKYKYLRLDGSTTIVDRRDMVRDFQRRNDIFVFLLSTRAGGLGINLTAADTVIFYESDWNPTLDLQAMDRAHRLGQTKEVTVYRLICKETIEEKILQRASQKNTVQQLVMTGGHVQGDLLKTEDVVSLLLDDAQLEQKLREIPLQQVKERQKKRRVTKGIRLDVDGEATFEDFPMVEVEGSTTSNKKKKSISKKQASNSLNTSTLGNADTLMDIDESKVTGSEDLSIQRRTKSAMNKNGSTRNSPVTGNFVSDPAMEEPYQHASAESRSYSEAETQVDTVSQSPTIPHT